MATDTSARLAVRVRTAARIPWGACCVSLLFLGIAALEVRGRGRRTEQGDYHAHIRHAAATTIPFCIDDWLGRELPSSPFAVALLKPNVLVNRVYQDLKSPRTANLLFVHCCDARDLLGHYPPVCYPAHGFVTEAASSRTWTVGDSVIEGMRYRYTRTNTEGTSSLVVDNFMALPTGAFGRDMDSVNQVARDPDQRRRGAAQVQIVTDAAMSDADRDAVFVAIVERIQPLLTSLGRSSGTDD